MLAANKETLASYFQGKTQYIVPFFQRAYIWEEENWQTLWDHLVAILEAAEGKAQGEHFIGTIITKQIPASQIGESRYDLIDGQQRLTTIALLLKAIGDSSDGSIANLKGVIQQCLFFQDSRGKSHSRVVPSANDQVYFESVMSEGDRTFLENQDHRVLRAYDFFRTRLEGFSDERLDLLQEIVLNKVPVICMMLASQDDEQEIFDTINALGVRLTTGELLKNFIFKDKELRGEYEPLWRDVYEASDEQVRFWEREKTAGRVTRTNFEVLLYCFLIMRTGREVKMESLFKEYKRWLHDKSPAEKAQFLKQLKKSAELFYGFPSEEELNQISFDEREKRFFHVIENLMVTTAYPLVLYAYTHAKEADREAFLGLLESYLVRRNVCRLTGKNYNQLFIQIMNRLEEGRIKGAKVDAKALNTILSSFEDVTNLMPDDELFKRGFHESPLSNQNSREILFLIALRQVADGLADMPRLSLGSYSTEHLMPVKWEEKWSAKLNAEKRAERNQKLKTLGNLTLVTGRLNSKMQNAAWPEKKNYLEPNSSLKMTTRYLKLKHWDESSIASRADDLAGHALEIWKAAV